MGNLLDFVKSQFLTAMNLHETHLKVENTFHLVLPFKTGPDSDAGLCQSRNRIALLSVAEGSLHPCVVKKQED